MKVKTKVRKSRNPAVGKIIREVEKEANKRNIKIIYKDEGQRKNMGECLWNGNDVIDIIVYLSSSERSNMLVLLHEWIHVKRFLDERIVDIGYFEYSRGEGKEGFWYTLCSLMTEVFSWKEVFEHMKRRGIKILPSDKKIVTECVRTYLEDLSRKIGGIAEVRKTDKIIIEILGG